MADFFDAWTYYTTSAMWNRLQSLGLNKKNVDDWTAERLDRKEYLANEETYLAKKNTLIIMAEGHVLIKFQKELDDYGMTCLPEPEEQNLFFTYMVIERLVKEDSDDAAKDASEETSGGES